MNIWEIDKALLFLVLFMPGFISIKIYDLMIAGVHRDFSKSLFEAIGYSVLNFAVLSWLILLIHSDGFYESHKFIYPFLLFLILVVFPVIWPILIINLRKWKPIARHVLHPINQPWDHVFGSRQAYWILVHLKNGKRIGGRYGVNSMASAFPHERQIYLQEVWHLKDSGGFDRPVNKTKGILISNDQIAMVEFFQ